MARVILLSLRRVPELASEDLTELEEIGEELQKRKLSHDAPDSMWVEEVQKQFPDLAPDHYFEALKGYLSEDPKYDTQSKCAEELNVTQGRISQVFGRITAKVDELKQTQPEPAEPREETLSPKRVNEILKSGSPTQLDPYAILPRDEDHPKYDWFR
ncbi:MAG: hypothetical protein GF309_06985, partial [Candidatus Lokiarchaeota archaeon]|nr:hypothetical protein [Candidatus Lokiarchaeota archaeon]